MNRIRSSHCKLLATVALCVVLAPAMVIVPTRPAAAQQQPDPTPPTGAKPSAPPQAAMDDANLTTPTYQAISIPAVPAKLCNAKEKFDKGTEFGLAYATAAQNLAAATGFHSRVNLAVSRFASRGDVPESLLALQWQALAYNGEYQDLFDRAGEQWDIVKAMAVVNCQTAMVGDGEAMSEAKRLRALEDENGKLKRLLADAMLDNAGLKDLLSKKW